MTAPSPAQTFDEFRGRVLEALRPLAKALERLLERLEPLAIRYVLRARYGATVRPCRVVPGSLVTYTARRLSAAQADEVTRLTAALRRAERRRDGDREATA